MSDWVEWGGKLFPRSFVEPGAVPGACAYCGGLGEIPETLDEERYPTMVPCWRCRAFCRDCRRWVAKSGHKCIG